MQRVHSRILDHRRIKQNLPLRQNRVQRDEKTFQLESTCNTKILNKNIDRVRASNPLNIIDQYIDVNNIEQ